jgi:hypothetical protein
MFLLHAYRVSSILADSRFKQWGVIEFLVHKNKSVVNIRKRLCAVDRSTVERWAKRVKSIGSAETELHDLLCAGCPATANTPDILNRAEAIICADWCITTQLALQLSISTGSVCSIIEKCCSSMTMHTLTQAWEPTSPKWVGQCCPIHPTPQIWHRRTSTSLGLSKMLCMELTLKMTTA